MTIGCLSNVDAKGKENVPSYQNVCVFLKKLFCVYFRQLSQLANIGELPYGVLGTTPNFGLICPCVYFLSSKHCRRGKFTVVFLQVVKKSTLDVYNLLFFIYLLSSLPSPSPLPSSLHSYTYI